MQLLNNTSLYSSAAALHPNIKRSSEAQSDEVQLCACYSLIRAIDQEPG